MFYRTVPAVLFCFAAFIAAAAAGAAETAGFIPGASTSEQPSERILFLCESVPVRWMHSVPIFGFERGGGDLRIPESARPACDAGGREGLVLSDPRVFVIGDARAGGRELGDLRLPFVRVALAPSSAKADADAVVNRRPLLGMFNALFEPAPAGSIAVTAPAAAVFAMPVAATVVEPVIAAFAAPMAM